MRGLARSGRQGSTWYPAARAVAALAAVAGCAEAWSNWDGEQTCNPVAIVNVTTEQDVAAAIARACSGPVKRGCVRVAGAGHSFSPIDLTNGTMLNLVPPATGAITLIDSRTVLVHAGVHLYDLNAALEGWGLALANIGAISMQTVAGATQTNTHGTGPTGGLSTFIVGMRLVLPNGTAITASATENPEIFMAARTGYGAFGVLVNVNLTVWPIWRMEQVSAPFDLNTLLTMLPGLLQQYDRLQWYWTPYTRNATLLVRANTTAPITGCWNSAPRYSQPVTPAPRGMDGWPAGTTACTDVSYKTMTHDGDDITVYTEQEMMVPVDGHLQLVSEFIAFQNAVYPQHNPNISLFTGVRYVTADDITLSPFHGRDTAVVSMIVFGNNTYGGDPTEVAMYDHGLEDMAFRQYAARPHPGKVNFFNASMMARVYPDTFGSFVRLLEETDPAGAMRNPYTERLFGI